MTPLRNWASAVHGSLFQFCIFLALNLAAGSDSVVGAIVADLVSRGLASRWWRSITHSLEPVGQWLRSAPRLAAGIAIAGRRAAKATRQPSALTLGLSQDGG
jgi:hypothetical protein